MNLVLLGLRGSGKSTLGRMTAERGRRAFVDLDDLTPRLLNAASIAEAWRVHGEPGFRRAEVQALEAALGGDGQVVALGGGTPTAPGAADLLRARQRDGRVRLVYLAAEASTLRERLAATDNSDRPSLTGFDPLVEIEAVLARRDPLYRGLADQVIETDGREPGELVDELLALLEP